MIMKDLLISFPVRLLIHVAVCVLLILSSCKKQDDWLNVKSTQSDVSPKSLPDLQAVLDNSSVMNSYGSIIGLVGTDNVYLPDANLDALEATSRNAYLWAKDIYAGSTAYDWYYNYQVVEYANIVLDALPAGSSTGQAGLIRGEALFYRSFAFYQLCQLYCKPYVAATAGTDPGIPLRLSSDVNTHSVRASVQQSYDQMLADLKTAVSLLPAVPQYKTRPGIVAAQALLAKVYLSMGDYTRAYTYADLVLKSNAALLDYNKLTITTSNPFPSFAKGHPEVIYHAVTYGLTAVLGASSAKGRVSPDLYSSYTTGDLRKTAFYTADATTGLFRFKGSYSAQVYNFCGIATDEIYLIRAECQARIGSLSGALADLNTLLKNRFTPATYIPYSTADQATLLSRIILERRKEMPFTGNLRWEDLRRLNADPQFAVTLQRSNHGTTYTLPPNDPRYVYPLPQDEITLDGLTQNNR